MNQLTLPYPLARDKDPMTSHLAAEKMVESGALSEQENQVFCWIVAYLKVNQKKDFTPKELVWWRYANKYHVIERRLSGLRNKGKIERLAEDGTKWIEGKKQMIREGCCVWRLAR